MMEVHQKNAAERFLKFVNKTGSPYHTVAALEEILVNAGFKRLYETRSWQVQKGRKYYIKRNESSIGAFVIGKQFASPASTAGKEEENSPRIPQSESGFVIAAAHTDSPCLRVRPNSAITSEGCVQLGVDCYGGGLWHTWFDRGLGLAGKVVVRSNGGDGGVQERLVRIPSPVCIIPNLAIHLQNAEERAAFKINKETQLRPVLGLADADKVEGSAAEEKAEGAALTDETTTEETENQCGRSVEHSSPVAEPRVSFPHSRAAITPHVQRMPPRLLNLLARELSCAPQDIVDVDLCLMDAWESRFCGIDEEFIESPRLDNLVSCWAAFTALAESFSEADKDRRVQFESRNVQVAVAFDHEEVGSESWTGANSSILKSWLSRIVQSIAGETIYDSQLLSILSRSFLLSADQAHAVHPNYADKHQAQHKPLINHGVVLKNNANQRYATHATSAAICRVIAQVASPPIPLQDFVVRNDSGCGSTIGPMSSAILGVSAIDIGVPQWAMHSCREVGGTLDIFHLQQLFLAFFQNYHIGLIK